MGKLFEELKRRKVFKIAAVYAVVAWLLIQIATTVMPALQIPEWTVSFVTVLFILGFPIALVLAWAYEVTPEGIRAEPSTPTHVPAVQSTDRKLIYATFVLVLLVAGFQIADRFLLNTNQNDQTANSVASSMLEGITPQVTRTSIYLGEFRPQRGGLLTEFDLSDDGSRLLYTAVEDEGNRFYLRNMNEIDAELLDIAPMSVAGSTDVSMSSGGERLVVQESGALVSKSLFGGPEIVIHENFNGTGFSWTQNQEIIFQSSENYQIFTVPIEGGDPVLLGGSDQSGVYGPTWPELLPDGEHMLVTSATFAGVGESGRIDVVNLATQEMKTIIERGYHARYAPSGHIVFMRENTLHAVAFDLETLEVVGEEAEVIHGISSRNALGHALYDFSMNGRLVYLPGEESTSDFAGFTARLAMHYKDAPFEFLDMAPMNLQREYREVSANGNHGLIVIANSNGTRDVWTYSMERDVLSRRTFDGSTNPSPALSPDESMLYYVSITDNQIRRVPLEGGQPENIGIEGYPLQITPNGRQILFYRLTEDQPQLYLQSLDVDGEAEPISLVPIGFQASEPRISPDGKWITYTSNETGEPSVFVRPFPDIENGKWQIDSAEILYPEWGINDGALYVVRAESDEFNVYRLEVDTEESFQYPELELNFEAISAYVIIGIFDSQSYLAARVVSDTPIDRELPQDVSLVVVENWFEELNQLSPRIQ